jgi:hypothetical protein
LKLEGSLSFIMIFILFQGDLDGGKTPLTRWAQLDRSLEADLHRISVIESVPELQPYLSTTAASQQHQLSTKNTSSHQNGTKSSLKDRFKEEVQMHFQVDFVF